MVKQTCPNDITTVYKLQRDRNSPNWETWENNIRTNDQNSRSEVREKCGNEDTSVWLALMSV